MEERHHLVQINTLLPSSSCSSSTKGPKSKASLDVLHKHGPCSQLNNNGKANSIPTHSDILNHDKKRINYIHSKLLSSSNNNDNKMKEIELDSSSANLPAKSGSLIGSGNYYVVVGLGTPKKDLSLIFDTDCTQLSSATGNDPGCASLTKACVYGIQYGDQSFSVGYFSRERLSVTSTDAVDEFLFGCGQDNQGLFGGSAGLLGLGRHPISFVQQTSAKYYKRFSYCLPSTSSAVGHLTFGATGNKYVKYTPFSTVSRSGSFYGLEIAGISVGGTKLPISSSLFTSGGAIIDSGTVITRLPPTVYASLRDYFRKGMARYPNASAISILDTCYDLSGTKIVSVPKVNFFLAGGNTVEIAAPGILYVVSLKQVCLAFAPNGDDSDITIFGNVQQRTLEVVYDVGAGKIGFGYNGCK
ncbi:unnamed protein product [Vicia faba]|uniref:Peptidase A1 domain-containing protein n=1 Tax=Vicia faba TaxID=3906 RepID=A0AAV0ZHG1_VICFA|nr:unnamed protein product [Vicia faba]